MNPKFALQFLALACVNILAVVYDGQWLYAAMAIDAYTLGVVDAGLVKRAVIP